MDADVVPCFVLRRLRPGLIHGEEGIKFKTDKGHPIISFPEQHYDNGCDKNKSTNQRYKSCVRILKNARNDMEDHGLLGKNDMPSFLLECLAWNVPDDFFNVNATWRKIIRSVMSKIWDDTRTKEGCLDYTEVSNLKWLFRGTFRWDHSTANSFINKAWDYIGL